MKYYLLCTLSLLIFSCKHSETKKIVQVFPNGQIGEIRYFEKIADTTTYRKEEFYRSGAPYYIGHVVKGKKSGNWIWWYPDGNKKDQCKYVNGHYADTVYHWNKNGTLNQLEIVSNKAGELDSCTTCNATIIRFYENGMHKEQFTSNNDVFQDTSKTWYENGQLEWYTIYKNGKREGISETFYKNGNKESQSYFHNGRLSGIRTVWDSTGKIISVENYESGQLVNN